MVRSFTIALLAVFCLHSAVAAQNANAPGQNGQRGASQNGDRVANPAADRARNNRDRQNRDRQNPVAEPRHAGQGNRPLVNPLTRGNSDVARTARERGRADSKLADRVRTKEESRRRDHKDRVARPSHRSDRPLTQRLAAIDRIRDRALETGNVQLLDRADRLEQSARREFRENMKASIDQPLPGEMDQSRMQGHAHWKTDETRRPYGQSISALARELGGEFGRQTSEQARESGREFGKMNADKTRPDIYQPVIDLPSEPPVKEPDTEPVVEPGGTEPGIKPDTEPVIEPGIEPVKEPDTEPVVEPGGTEPVVEPATEPVKEPDTDSNSDSAG